MTTIVNAAVSPALIVPLSAVLTTWTSGQSTVTVTGPVDGLPSFELVALAEFTTSPQVAAVVGEVRWTVTEAPGAIDGKVQVRTPFTIEQSCAPVPPSIDQLRPPFVGSVSLTTTFLAVPWPLFVTVIV